MSDQILLEVINLIRETEVPGYGWDEVGFLTAVVLDTQPQAIFEWGTNRGSSARIFYEASEHLETPPPIHTVELPNRLSSVTADHAGKQTGMFVKGVARVRRHRGDGVTVALKLFALNPVDKAIFFIDGDHSPAAATRELLLVTEAAPKATIILHDTNHPKNPGPTGPAEAVEALLSSSDRYSMVELKSQAGMIKLAPL